MSDLRVLVCDDHLVPTEAVAACLATDDGTSDARVVTRRSAVLPLLPETAARGS